MTLQEAEKLLEKFEKDFKGIDNEVRRLIEASATVAREELKKLIQTELDEAKNCQHEKGFCLLNYPSKLDEAKELIRNWEHIFGLCECDPTIECELYDQRFRMLTSHQKLFIEKLLAAQKIVTLNEVKEKLSSNSQYDDIS